VAQPTAVAGDDPVRDREAKAGAFVLGFRAEERLEQVVGDSLGHARTVIHHRDANPFRVARPLSGGADPQSTAVDRAQRLERIEREIDQYLLDLAAVQFDGREICRDIDLQFDPSGVRAVGVQEHDAVDQ